jgi:3',5'-cyclic AMP phosphodiesterase CpdA
MRQTYVPGPLPTTYPEGASPASDYYAFTWGDALFIVLNVMTYTTTPHLLGADPGLPDDWTLGEAQLAWLATTLASATSKWKFVFVHHAVGGAAADYDNSAYGRGGGQAAQVGEQAKVHALMLKYGVQVFFYGHDHVFTDMVVDGIHYAEPGSAGAIWLFSSNITGYQTSWLTAGWGQVTVSPSKVDVGFMAVDGRLVYGFTLGL